MNASHSYISQKRVILLSSESALTKSVRGLLEVCFYWNTHPLKEASLKWLFFKCMILNFHWINVICQETGSMKSHQPILVSYRTVLIWILQKKHNRFTFWPTLTLLGGKKKEKRWIYVKWTHFFLGLTSGKPDVPWITKVSVLPLTLKHVFLCMFLIRCV